ncbi:hypothetical protein CGZ80_21305 [Rhodopirellula sp. MGV]|nr:hypothetical protein CGZ80_21305 [Rhodopirellula sp. MGV]PNY36045.1 hypothetical protein C2E31_15120 [Rhodopirellula baltica]
MGDTGASDFSGSRQLLSKASGKGCGLKDEGLDEGTVHAGYEFEGGMFNRVRGWVDLAPWLRLFRVLRLLASPSYLACSIVAVIASSLVLNAFQIFPLLKADLFGPSFSLEIATSPSSPLAISPGQTHLLSIAGLATCLVAIWAPTIQCLARAGASLSADRGLPPLVPTIKLVLRRLLSSYLIPIILCFAIAVMLLGLYLISLPASFMDHHWLTTATGWLVGVVGVPIGVAAAGAVVATPLGWCAMVCEPDPDPIDSISRGYESLFRRPLHLLWYTLIVSLLLHIARQASDYITVFSHAAWSWIAVRMPSPIDFAAAASQSTSLLLTAWFLLLACGLLGGVYLLLRRDTGGQDVEDFWKPAEPDRQPLPELPPQAYES